MLKLMKKIRKVLQPFLNLNLDLNLAILILRIAAIYYSRQNWYNTIYRLNCNSNTGLRLKRCKRNMQRVKQFFRGTVFKGEGVLLTLIFLFIIGNWIFLTMAEELGPPDFYKMYDVAEKLFAGDLKIDIIPPLFSLLLYPLGKLLSIFFSPPVAFITAGRLIALAASLGATWFSYLILKKIVGKWALFYLVFLVISPWYLKLISFPITNMLYLFFVAVSFYAFLNQSAPGVSLLTVIGGVLTRFEGVLLILSAIINYFKLKKRYVLILLGLLAVILVIFLIFMPRIFAHLKDIIIPYKSYLVVFRHPMEFFNVLYGNLLFFIPHNYPYLIKLAALLVLFIFFVYGVYRLYKMNKTFTLSLVVYEILFFVAKGYIDTSDPDREFRRVFSGLWIFYLISFIGGFFLLKKISSYKIPRILIFSSGIVFLAILVCFLTLSQIPVLFLGMLLVLPLLYPLTGLALEKIPKYLGIIVLLAFMLQIYNLSFFKSKEYVINYANKTPFAAARWLNFSRLKQNPVILSYTNNTMLQYYLIKKKIAPLNIQWVEILVPLDYEQDRERYRNAFFRALKEKSVDYIIFDNYVVQKPEFLYLNESKLFLFEERENTTYFKLKNLFYKGQNVGYVLRPVLDP